jgi:hypothetical protein
MNPCVNNFRLLDGAKQTWALEYGKTNKAAVKWDELRSYLKQPPVCPRGGAYLLGRVGEPPGCSLGGSHALPQ